MIMKDYTDKTVEEYMRIPFPAQAGDVYTSVHFAPSQDPNARERIRIGFMSARGKPFYIDEVTIRQNIREGETCYAPYLTTFPTEPTETVRHEMKGQSFVYDVQALRTRLYRNYASEISSFMLVQNPSDNAINGSIAVDSDHLIICMQEGGIVIKSSSEVLISLLNISGNLLSNLKLPADVPKFIPLAPGSYLIRTSQKSYKVYVRQ